MSAPERYLRLFDVKKYREIQPIIEGIVRHDAKAEQVIPLIKAAQRVVQTDDFKKYNPDWFVDSSNISLRGELEILERNNISTWFEELDRSSYPDTLDSIVHYICCPKYQFKTEDLADEEISGTTVDCSYFVWCSRISGLELSELLNFNNNVIERFPFDSYYDGADRTFLYDRLYLAEFTRAAIEDVDALSQSDINLDGYHHDNRSSAMAYHLKFYDNFKFLLELANLSEDYTLLCQDYAG